MYYHSWNEAMEAFCQSITDEEQDLLEATGMLYDAFEGWVAVNNVDWGVVPFILGGPA